ncbi:hypothetical protein HNY73_004397 [Argiope bruennichi]|uniref:Helitron helicase-like domain-containing protein n=1 Tax=Argiope bruennichi TaxID=94029 RepID=A0A8T0FRR3_ARGBR|nr:hypothetical protein HNY73_004397 [Argiope bruennichi]
MHSCTKLCYSRDISFLNRLRKAIDTSIWKNLLNYYKTNNLDHSPYICHLCLQKIRANQLPAACFLNDLHVSTVPPQITELNDYEKILIQRAKAFQVVMQMNPVANKHLPNRHMVKKVKGRTFHLPLPLEETLKKLPRPEHPITKPEMYIMVREDNIHHIVDQLESQVDNVVEGNDGLLTQVTSEKMADYEQYTIYPLHERRRNAPISELYQMLKVNAAPIDSRDKDLDVKCFPDLYVEGKYGQFYARQQKLTSSEYIKARLMSKHSQFRLNQQYLFFLLNDVNIRQINSGIFYKMNCVNQKQKITAEQYFEMLNKDELEGDLTAIFGRLRNTEQFWKKPRNDVNCMTQHYGPATWFLTMSPSEWMWDDLGEYLKEVNSPEMANKSISELVALDPVSTSRFIDNKFKAMLDFLMSSNEPLGKVIHYFWRREYQSRGVQHFHLMLWVKDAPILRESSLDEVASFISKYITCAIPDKNISPTLYQRVMSYQTHKHNKYCMRQKKTRRGFVKVCRFGFPRPVTEVLTIRDITESIAARKTLSPNSRLYYIVRKKEWVMVNDYNPAVLLAWNGNTDIQYVGEKTAILNYYVTKYTTKSEKTHVADMFQDINSTKPLRSRLFNIGLRVLSSRECGSWKPVTLHLVFLVRYRSYQKHFDGWTSTFFATGVKSNLI